MNAPPKEDAVSSSDVSAGWHGSFGDFLSEPYDRIRQSLTDHHLLCMGELPGEGQLKAWRNSHPPLVDAIRNVVNRRPESVDWSLILEFELPRERGRRPDAILLAPGRAVVIEFKEHRRLQQAHVDQVTAYARDLNNYHEASHDLRMLPVMVSLHRQAELEFPEERLHFTTPEQLSTAVWSLLGQADGEPLSRIEWLASDYAPLPTLIAAARNIFNHEPLPAIRQARSAGIPATLDYLDDLVASSRIHGKRHLVLITGVPGAGKTLVGLQFVYQRHLSSDNTERAAVFLSGNGPLVKVLQHALKSSVFVQDVHGFLKQYGGRTAKVPREHIWVYDEAQRAWDQMQSSKKRPGARSEPEEFLRLANRLDDWAVLVGLVGEGQEIHVGEEAGVGQWRDAVLAVGGDWKLHCPPKLAPYFSQLEDVDASAALDLTVSLRSHLAVDVQDWVRELLNGRLDQAHSAAIRAGDAGFEMYITDDLEVAKSYVKSRYQNESTKRFGLIASSKARDLEQYGVMNTFSYSRRFREGPWYNGNPDDPDSCCQLKETATEFQAQGLELDLPIVCWGDDLKWDGATWQSRPSPRSQAKNPHQLRMNSYRVLLSRGRDGLIVFLPPTADPMTRNALEVAGLQPIKKQLPP